MVGSMEAEQQIRFEHLNQTSRTRCNVTERARETIDA